MSRTCIIHGCVGEFYATTFPCKDKVTQKEFYQIISRDGGFQFRVSRNLALSEIGRAQANMEFPRFKYF